MERAGASFMCVETIKSVFMDKFEGSHVIATFA
jgi:hypothetical protein